MPLAARSALPFACAACAAAAAAAEPATAAALGADAGQPITVEAVGGDPVYAPDYADSQTWLPAAPMQKRLTVAEAMDLPGVLGDPIKAVAQLPGVVVGGFGQFFVHGSKESESSPTINHLPVGYLFHLGGLHSVVSPEAIDQIDAYLGGFDVTYGDAIGGVIDVTPRYPAGDDGGYIHLGLLDSSFGLDADLSRLGLGPGWAFSAHGRRSYLDLLIPVDALGGGGEDEDRITTFPNYYDVNGILSYTAGSHRFSLESILANDEFGAELRENAVKDPAATGSLNARYGFSSTGLRWRYDDPAYSAMTLGGYLRQWTRFQLFRDYALDLVAETFTGYHLSTWHQPAHEVSVGAEVQFLHVPVDAVTPAPSEEDAVDRDLTSRESFVIRQTLDAAFYSLFIQDVIRLREDLRLRLGLRGEHADLGAYEPHLMPRGAVVYDIGRHDTLSLSAGMYSARPEPYKYFDRIGNPRLTDERSVHVGLAWNHHSEAVGEWTIEPYWKHLSHLALSDGEERYRNVGEGTAHGIDVSWKLRARTWYLSLAYAWQEAQRQLTSEDPRQYSLYGDVPHTAQLAGSWAFAPAWSASFLAKYATGQPYTPIVGTYLYTDADGSTRLRPSYGTPYSRRFPDYFTLNLRGAWTAEAWGNPLELALEIINATNYANVQGYEYDDEYNRKGEVTGLPFLAALNATYRF